MGTFTIEEVNGLRPAEFVELFGGVYSGSWWVAEAAQAERPFLDFDHLLLVMREVVEAADGEQGRVAMGSHRELGGAHREARREVRELVGSEFSVRLTLPAWVDDEISERPPSFTPMRRRWRS